MVATKVLISLCVFGACLVSGAPQAGGGVNQDEAGIVNNVVTALQPQIAEAVAAALRGLSFGSGGSTSSTSTTTTTNTEVASNSGPPESTFTAGGGATGFGFSGTQVGFGLSGSRGGFAGGAGSRVGGSSSGSSGGAGSRVGVAATGGSSGAAFGASGAAEEVTARASYAYEYKVADDEEQTYISHNEARDGDDVTGQYSYIDPNGDLVTVTYQAGAMGYTQTVERKVGQVQIRQKDNQRAAADRTSNVGATSTGNSAGGASSGFSFGSSTSGTSSSGFVAGVAALPPPQVIGPTPQVVEETISTVTTTGTGGSRSSAGGLDEAALIAQIISVLQPQINQAVTSVITQQ